VNPAGPDGADEVILSLEDVSRIYGEEVQVRALDGVSMEIRAGEFVSIVGPSGSGKSTMLGLLGILDLPTHGVIRVRGVDAAELSDAERSRLRGDAIGFVFQQFHLIPYLDVLDNVLVGELAGGNPPEQLYERAESLLEQFHLDHRRHHVPSALSVGEQQRVALARALLRQPSLLLADEPTGNLDPDNARILLRHLAAFARDGGGVLMVTHDREARAAADRALHLQAGKLVEPDPPAPAVSPT